LPQAFAFVQTGQMGNKCSETWVTVVKVLLMAY
jgi:hypothetical protein